MKIIKQKLSKDFETINLYVASDVHIGSPTFNEKAFKRFIDEVASQENNFLVLNGDIMETAIVGSKGDVYTQVLTPEEQIAKAVELFTPVKDKILAFTTGNHEMRISKHVNIDISQVMAVQLFGAEKAEEIYTSGPYTMFLEFGKNLGRENRQTIYSVLARHGSGGGGRVGSKINQLENMTRLGNHDLFIHSHTHVPAVYIDTVTNIDYRNKKINTKECYCVNSNAFLNADGGYGEKLGLRPQAITWPKIKLSGYDRKIQVEL